MTVGWTLFRLRRIALGVAIVAEAWSIGLPALGEDTGALFTARQADQGSVLYSRQCARCHGAKLEGGAGPALSGPAFLQLAAGQNLTAKSLFDLVSTTMSMSAPGRLTPDEYQDLVAFLLRTNSYPAGSMPLNKDNPALSQLKLAQAVSPFIRMASSGVYTAAQAARGKALYSDNCLACHGGDLSGVEDAPALRGTSFLAKWGGLPVGAVHGFIDKNMPPGNGGALGAVSEADIVSYILSRNNFPAGSTPLPSDPQGLSAITMDKTGQLQNN